MITKKISFKSFETFFYEKIKVNQATNEQSVYSTPIFYKFDGSNIMISFEYMGFCIETLCTQSDVQDSYLKFHPEDDEELDIDIGQTNEPDKIRWFIDKFTDERGIPEEK